jgi:hypothetical protein
VIRRAIKTSYEAQVTVRKSEKSGCDKLITSDFNTPIALKKRIDIKAGAPAVFGIESII